MLRLKRAKESLLSVEERLERLASRFEQQESELEDLENGINLFSEVESLGALFVSLEKLAARKDPDTGLPIYKPDFYKTLKEEKDRFDYINDKIKGLVIDMKKFEGQFVEAEKQKEEEEQLRKHRQVVQEQKKIKEQEEKELQMAKKREQDLVEENRRKISIMEVDANKRRAQVSERDKRLNEISANLEAVKTSFWARMEGNTDELAVLQGLLQENTVELQKALLDRLFNLFSGIVKDPSQEMYRKLNLENQRVNEHFVQIIGGVEILLFAGFEISDQKFINHETNQLKRMLFLELKEPPPEKDFDAWHKWYTRVKTVHESIQFVKSNMSK